MIFVIGVTLVIEGGIFIILVIKVFGVIWVILVTRTILVIHFLQNCLFCRIWWNG